MNQFPASGNGIHCLKKVGKHSDMCYLFLEGRKTFSGRLAGTRAPAANQRLGPPYPAALAIHAPPPFHSKLKVMGNYLGISSFKSVA